MKRTTEERRKPSGTGALIGTLLAAGAISMSATGSVRAFDGVNPMFGQSIALSAISQKSGDTPVGVPKAPPMLPANVLLFPAKIPTDSAAAAAALPQGQKNAEAIVTDGIRKSLSRGTIGVVTYSAHLPSIQRAISEGLKPDDAMAGPGDDPRKAQRFATIVDAGEYLTVTIDNYKYDQGSRTVTFDLSVSRFAADGAGLGSTALKAIGSAPATVSGPRQESFAVEEATNVVADQTVMAIYPDTTAIINPPKDDHKKHKKNLGSYLLVPVIAVGAALVGPHT